MDLRGAGEGPPGRYNRPMLLERPKGTVLTAVTMAAIAFSAGVYAILGFFNNLLPPFTIIDLEFAGTAARLSEMVAVWGQAGVDAAQQSLYLDFAFIPCYVLAFSGLTLLVTRSASGAWQRAGLVVVWFPVVAGVLDVTENVSLLMSLPSGSGALPVAAVCAGVKFLLLAVTLGFVIVALIRKVFSR